MSLEPGSRLGPYEIVASLGAGGMGEVYRARDTRLKRDVAIKVLPDAIKHDEQAKARFEREARAVAALSHPNVLAVHDFGEADAGWFVVMELLEGETLRDRMTQGVLPTRKALDYGLQIAQGLAAAHDKGVVHRDLKPANLFITREGRVKILDFGIAKLRGPIDETTVAAGSPDRTAPGVVMGTAGYMSPEQVRGAAIDHRTDLFSLGVVLYEMVVGRRAFQGDSAIETMNAILTTDPPPLLEQNPSAPAGLARVIDRCLEKNAEDRFSTARDVSFAIEALQPASGSATPASASAEAARRRGVRPVSIAAAAIIALTTGVAGWVFRAQTTAPSPAGDAAAPRYRPVTFGRGTVTSARFAADGRSVLYGAGWEGQPTRLYLKMPESMESTTVNVPPADVLATSGSGEIALALNRRFLEGWVSAGVLARAPMAGGAPRQLVENIQEADLAPDGSTFAVVRRVDQFHQLEYPIGTVLYRTPHWISGARISPDGQRVAIADHPIYGDDRGTIVSVDRNGRRSILTGQWSSVRGLVWTTDGAEVWFAAAESGSQTMLRAVTADGARSRIILRVPGRLVLYDRAPNGQVLLARESLRSEIVAVTSGDPTPRNLSWLDYSAGMDLSSDGRTLLFSEFGDGGGPEYATYLRPTDGSPAVRLSEGFAMALSPDGASALALELGAVQRLVLVPTGAGQPQSVARGRIESYRPGATWLPDGKRIVFTANEPGRGSRVYLQTLPGETPRAVTPEGVGFWIVSDPVSPDGSQLLAVDESRRVWTYPMSGADGHLIEGLEPGDAPIRWTPDGEGVYFWRPSELPVVIYRFDVATRRRSVWKTTPLQDRAGVIGAYSVLMSADGQSYVCTYTRALSELYEVSGIK